MVFEAGLEGDLLGEHLHDGQEGKGRLVEGVTRASHNPAQRRQHLGRLDIVFDLRLDGLVEFYVSKQSALRFGLELPVLELF